MEKNKDNAGKRPYPWSRGVSPEEDGRDRISASEDGEEKNGGDERGTGRTEKKQASPAGPVPAAMAGVYAGPSIIGRDPRSFQAVYAGPPMRIPAVPAFGGIAMGIGKTDGSGGEARNGAGSAGARFCPECGAMAEESAKFCTECGHLLPRAEGDE